MTTLSKQGLNVSAAVSTERLFRILGVLTAALGLAVVAGSASAGPNLLINGGFETGDFTGWVQNGNTGFANVICPGPLDPRVDEGNCSAELGPFGSDGLLGQGVNLVVGQSYVFSFAFLPDPDGAPTAPSDFSACFGVLSCGFGGVPLLSLTNPAPGPYELFSFKVVATAPAETVSFSFRDDGPNNENFLHLDAVSVVPEPATVALLGAGLGGLFFGRRRKAR